MVAVPIASELAIRSVAIWSIRREQGYASSALALGPVALPLLSYLTRWLLPTERDFFGILVTHDNRW